MHPRTTPSPALLAAGLAAWLASPAFAQEEVLYYTDFTSLDGWTVIDDCPNPPWSHDYFWAADATPADHPAGPFRSAPASLNFNDGVNLGGEGCCSPRNCGRVRSDLIDLSVLSGTPRLRFWASWDCETGCQWDILSLTVLSPTWVPLLHNPCLNDTHGNSTWRIFEVDLDPSWGAVRIQFEFDTIDAWDNGGTGPFIDDLQIVGESSVFCLGDGSEGDCPCSNDSPPDQHAGCGHSNGGFGQLRAQGSASLSDDGVVLMGSGMTDQPVVYFQGDATQPATPYGDGLRCATGSVVRLGIRMNASGASSWPGTGDPPISVGGMISEPGLRHYQAWYRDPAPFCTPAGFNMTNAVSVLWQP